MGNAAVIINHPTSLDHGQPVLDGGEVAAEEPGMIRIERCSGTPAGCGGTITFKRNVQSCESSNTQETENTVTVGGGIKAEAKAKGPLASATGSVSASIEVENVVSRQDSTKIQHIVSDENEMSELWCHVDYVGKKGKYKWLSNDLNLKAKHRWSENSEMFLKITFRKDSDSDTDPESEYQDEEGS